MIIKCPKCQQVPPASDVNIHKAIAVCKDCDHGFSIGSSPANSFPSTAIGLLSSVHRMNQMQNLFQENIQGREVENNVKELGEHDLIVHRDYDGIEIKYPWRKGGIKWFFLIFAIVWNAVSLPVFFFGVLPNILNGKDLVSLVFIIHPLVGITIGYYVIASFFNKTTLKIGRDKLEVKIGPFPWFGNKEFETKKIEQLYVERYVPYTQNRMPVINYQVKIILEGHVNVVLIKGINKYHNALAFEVLTEKYLNIEDQAVESDVLNEKVS